MQALLKRIGIARGDVRLLGETHKRARLVSEAMRPAATTERWATRIEEAKKQAAFGGISVIEAANAEDEALAIAVALREAVDTPGKTAALVTPDRVLARRAIAALARWNVAVDDSGGDALRDTEAGVFARLAAEVTLGEFAPVTLLALLKHPRFRLGRSCARSLRLSARSCADRARVAERRGYDALAGLRVELGVRVAKDPACIAPIRAPT